MVGRCARRSDALGAKKPQQVVAVDEFNTANPAEIQEPDGGPYSNYKCRIKWAKALKDGGFKAKFLQEPETRCRRRRLDPFATLRPAICGCRTAPCNAAG